MIDKITLNGTTAILYSPKLESGWSSIQPDSIAEEVLFDVTAVNMVLQSKPIEEIVEYAKNKWDCFLPNQVKDLVVVWIHQGIRFNVKQSNNHEVIEYGSFGRYIA